MDIHFEYSCNFGVWWVSKWGKNATFNKHISVTNYLYLPTMIFYFFHNQRKGIGLTDGIYKNYLSFSQSTAHHCHFLLL